MVAMPTFIQERTTGRVRHRRGLFGRMVLQVEGVTERFRARWPRPGGYDDGMPGEHLYVEKRRWRDATPEEAFELDLRSGFKTPAT